MKIEAKLWGALTNAEKGALLLAAHEGKKIEFCAKSGVWTRVWRNCIPNWSDKIAYRISPEPVVENITLYGGYDGKFEYFDSEPAPKDTRKLTLPMKEGEPVTGTYTSEAGDVVLVEKIE